MPQTSTWEVPLERKGGSSPSANPHVCVYAAVGVTPQQCIEITKIYRRNIDGCSAVKCNAVWRLCFKCVEERAVKPERSTNATVGMCERHGIAAGLYKKAPPAAPVPTSNKPFAIDTTEFATMPQSTTAECMRIDELNERERYVLHQLSYGFDTRSIDNELTKRADSNGASFSTTFPTICRKLGITDIPREKDRIYKAGKIYLDAKERERNGARILMGDDAVTDVERPDDTDSTDQRSVDAKTVPTPVMSERMPKPQLVEEDTIVPTQSVEMSEALAVAARFKQSRVSDSPSPHITELFTAVQTMRNEGIKGEPIGRFFGCEGASGAAWTSVMVNLSRVSQATWKALGAKNISISAMKTISLLPNNEQVDALQKWLERNDAANAGAKAAPKRAAPPQVIGADMPTSAPDATDVAANLAEEPTDHVAAATEASEPVIAEPVIAAAPVVVATPVAETIAAAEPATATAEPAAPTSLLPVTAPDLRPVTLDQPRNGNGHDLASLLPVRISLDGLGDFTDVDIEPVELGQDASAQRMERIASRRKDGFKPVEIVMHPALPRAQMIYTKK